MPDFLPPDEEERQEVTEVSPGALAILNQSEHAAMVQTANVPTNKRKLEQFDSKLMAYANHSQPIALSMFYSLPRAGKQIIGASVRFAEIVAPCWRNCAVGARVIGSADTTATAQGIFIDYEANLRNSIEVPRRITDKDGKRYSEDMIVTTLNAAMSVARRNAVLKGGVPQALWTPAYDAAQLTAVGKADSMAQRIANAIDFLHKLGVTEWQILNAVGVPSVRELETEHLVTLRVLCQEIKRGDKTIEDVFGSQHDKEIESLFAQLKYNMAQQTMVRNSYMGRAADLVAYLRDRVAPVRSATPQVPVPKPKPEPVPEKPEPVPEKPTKPEPPPAPEPTQPEAPEAHLWTDEEVAALKAEGAIVEDPAASFVPVEFEPPYKPTDFTPEPHKYGMPDVPRAQTSMEPPPKRRPGRPSREELARRAASQQTPPTTNEESEPGDQNQFAF